MPISQLDVRFTETSANGVLIRADVLRKGSLSDGRAYATASMALPSASDAATAEPVVLVCVSARRLPARAGAKPVFVDVYRGDHPRVVDTPSQHRVSVALAAYPG